MPRVTWSLVALCICGFTICWFTAGCAGLTGSEAPTLTPADISMLLTMQDVEKVTGKPGIFTRPQDTASATWDADLNFGYKAPPSNRDELLVKLRLLRSTRDFKPLADSGPLATQDGLGEKAYWDGQPGKPYILCVLQGARAFCLQSAWDNPAGARVTQQQFIEMAKLVLSRL